MTGSSSKAGGLALSLVSAASFSTAGSFARSLTGSGWSPPAAVTARIGIAALILLVPTLIALRGRWDALRRNGVLIALYGATAVAGGQVCFFNAVQSLSVGVALLIEYLGVILVVGWMWLRHGHAPRRLTLAGSLVALVGLALIIDIAGDRRVDAVGIFWAMGGALALAIYFVLSARGEDGLPPVVLAGGGMIVGTAMLLVLGGIGALPMQASFGTVEFAGGRASWLVPVLGLSVFAAAVAYTTGIAAARRLGAKLATFLGLTEVLFAVLFAWLLLGELPSALQVAGGALILGGVALVRADEVEVATAVTPQGSVNLS